MTRRNDIPIGKIKPLPKSELKPEHGYCRCGDILEPEEDSKVDYTCLGCGAPYRLNGRGKIIRIRAPLYSEASFSEDPIKVAKDETDPEGPEGTLAHMANEIARGESIHTNFVQA